MFSSPKSKELESRIDAALASAEKIRQEAKENGRSLTTQESQLVDSYTRLAGTATAELRQYRANNSLADVFHNQGPTAVLGGKGDTFTDAAKDLAKQAPRFLTSDYAEQFYDYVRSGGRKMGAALYEGSNSGGGYAVPIQVSDLIVPLAPAEIGVREIASVIGTAMDIKIPQKSAFGGGIAVKTESGSSAHLFAESDPSLGQFTLSAFMLGGVDTISWELAQDVPLFQQFCVEDLLKSIAVFEDNKFVNGSGSGEPQGLLGNVGAGVTGVLVGSDGYLSELMAALFDVLGTLNAVYHPNASWLMNRATATSLRKQQMESNLFNPLWTRVGNRDYLLGYPVQYSAAMPTIAAAATPVLFGDFKAGYIIGDRGGSGISMKILDQPLATQGQIQLLAYERTDGRVRRSEAIQGITLHS